MKLQLTALSNSLLHPYPSFYLPGLSPEPPRGVLWAGYPHFSASLKEWILGWFSSTWVTFVTTLPSVFHLLKSPWTLSSADELFFVCYFVCCRGFILFLTLADVHHLNWKLPHKLYIDLSWVNKTTLQASQDFTSPIISRRRITKLLNNLKQWLETLAKTPSLDSLPFPGSNYSKRNHSPNLT